jgi:hypothetical protein
LKNKSSKIAFSGIISALSLVLMILTFIPNLTYSLPAIAGALLVAIVIEVGIKYAFLSYFVISLLSFFLATNKFSVLLFVLFFGYYPILKAIIEKNKNNIIILILKLLNFNIAFLIIYKLAISILSLENNILINNLKGWIGLGIILIANIVFYLYDLAIDNVVGFYLNKLRKHIKNKI